MRKMAAKTPKKPIPRPKNRFAAAVYNLVTDRRFELAVMVAILLNMVVMAIESHDANDKVLFILEQLNNVFVGVFGAEVILKLIGLRQHYFTVPWNVFDLVVVVVSVVASALSDLISHFVQPTIFRIVRLFRVTRVLRLIREAKVSYTYNDSIRVHFAELSRLFVINSHEQPLTKRYSGHSNVTFCSNDVSSCIV